MKTLSKAVAMISLVGCVIITAIWWARVLARRPPLDLLMMTTLVAIAVVQVAAWLAVMWLIRQSNAALALWPGLLAAGLATLLLFSLLLNGFTPALGTPISFVVFCAALVGTIATRRLTHACN